MPSRSTKAVGAVTNEAAGAACEPATGLSPIGAAKTRPAESSASKARTAKRRADFMAIGKGRGLQFPCLLPPLQVPFGRCCVRSIPALWTTAIPSRRRRSERSTPRTRRARFRSNWSPTLADLKLSWLAGQSRRVEDCVAEAAGALGLDAPAQALIRRAGRIYSMGSAAIPSQVRRSLGVVAQWVCGRVLLNPSSPCPTRHAMPDCDLRQPSEQSPRIAWKS